jgi:hypothetical protein
MESPDHHPGRSDHRDQGHSLLPSQHNRVVNRLRHKIKQIVFNM